MNRIPQSFLLFGAVFLVLFGALGFAIYQKSEKNTEIEQANASLRNEIDALNTKTRDFDNQKKYSNEIEDSLDDIIEILPTESAEQLDRIKQDMTKYSSLSNLTFIRVITKEGLAGGPAALRGDKKNPKAAKPEFGTQFQPTELTMQYQGGFADFLRFLTLVEQRKKFLRVDKIVLNPKGSGDARRLDIELTLTTFHFKVSE